MDDTERAGLDRFEGEHPDIASYATFAAGGDPGLERLHLVGQWLAERAVTGATDELRAGGQRLALDLPVGTRGDSWETWRWPELFVRGAQIGAPPDTFFRAGQNWGLPPLNPVASRRDGHRVWHDLLVVACRHAGVLRIDHVMQVHRLWWIPEGHAADDGAYVHYPADELLAVAAIVAHRTGTLMVGEDLGTVPKAVSRLLADWGLIGMHEEDFTVHWWADDEPPARFESVPARTWAGIRTHDMAPLARMVEEVDTTPYRAQLGATIGRDVSADPFELAVAMTERLRSSDAYEVVLDIDDLLGVRDAHNVPGTVGPDNWSRRHVAPIEDLIAEPRIERLLCTTATNDEREGTP
jgi:4-alpha-glucanotransferase